MNISLIETMHEEELREMFGDDYKDQINEMKKLAEEKKQETQKKGKAVT